jgi:hypothetical protein
MCNNYPNCNCPSCTQCQDCTQVTPTCNCTTTCTCSTEQFTEECPNGLQSTDCLIYTGDNLKNCQNNDFLLRGTNFNTFLSQLWETVKCAATATTDTIDYTGAAIKTCDNNTTIVPTNTPVTTALNNIWNHIKCWNSSLTTLINDRQPVWKQGYPIAVDPTFFPPFNNINTAITEITKYHHDVTGPVRIRLSDGSHTLNTDTFGNWNSQSGSFQIESNAPLSATLNLPNGLTIDSFNLIIRGIHTIGEINVINRGNLISIASKHKGTTNNDSIITLQNSSSFTATDCLFEGYNVIDSKGILAVDNSKVNIFTNTSYQEPYYSNFYLLFDIQHNSSLSVNNSTSFQAENIQRVLSLNRNSKASFNGLYCEFSGVNQNLTDSIGFLVSNNSNLYLQNISLFGGYYNPIKVENNSQCMFEDFLSLVSNFGIEVSNNSYFTGNTDSNLTITTLANYYFTSTHNSKINLAKSIVTGLGSVSYAYYLSHNSEISFNSATNPTPQTSNTYVGTSPIGFLFPNTLILPPNADATKLGCALYLY